MPALTVAPFPPAAKPLSSYKPFWAKRFGPAPFLPTTRAEMDALGWDSCDIVIVSGDAYVDHPSFGMAVIGRMLENQGFRVGIIAQPDWLSAEPFKALGKPNLFWGVTAGNMDSMINRYTADRKLRSDDAYTPGGNGGLRPDRAATVYSQRCREAFPGVPIVLGGIEGSLRRIAHYDYWSDKVRRSVLMDSKADLLLYGNAERAIVEVAHRLAAREPIEAITDLRGTAFIRRRNDPSAEGWFELDSTEVDRPGRIDQHINPYMGMAQAAAEQGQSCALEDAGAFDPTNAAPKDGAALGGGLKPASKPIRLDVRAAVTDRVMVARHPAAQAPAHSDVRDEDEHEPDELELQPEAGTASGATPHALPTASSTGTVGAPSGRIVMPPRERTVIRLPAYEALKDDSVLYAHANRVLHLETNPGNARALVQRHGEGPGARDVWINPPPIPLTTPEMDLVFDLPYARAPHPSYGDAVIPAWDMIRFSINIMRGCFGGCTFCSITEHEGRIIQSRSEASVLREIETIRDKVKGFTGVISDLGGPTTNMYRIGCKSPVIEAACRKPSCVYPDICPNLNTDHGPLIRMYRRARVLPGIKKILIGSGLRYDLAVRSPEYIKELVTHHVGGYLKIAPEHTEQGPLSKMMKPGMGAYDRFKELFEKYSAEAGKKQYLIPYFIAAHPGTTDEDMMNLAIWLKRNGFKADQVQTFYPSPMATATAMYHSGMNPLKGISRHASADGRKGERVDIVKGEKRRRLHKAFLRYHDPNNWPLLREALMAMGRRDLIGNGPNHLIPTYQPVTDGTYESARRKNSTKAGTRTSVVTVGRVQRNDGSGSTATPDPRKAPARQGASVQDTERDPRDLPKLSGKTRQPARGQILTQHTGLPPRATGACKPAGKTASPTAPRAGGKKAR